MFHFSHTFIHLIYSGSYTLNLVMDLRGLATNLSHSSAKFRHTLVEGRHPFRHCFRSGLSKHVPQGER